MSEKEWYKINELADRVNIPHQTLRRYIINHKHLIHFKKHHKAYNIHKSNEEIIHRIRELYSDGLTTDEINEALTTNPEIIVTMEFETENGKAREKVELNGVLNELRKQIYKQNEYIEKLTEALEKQSDNYEKQQEYIKEKLEDRDQKIMQVLNNSQKTQMEIASTKEDNKRTEITNFYERMKRIFTG